LKNAKEVIEEFEKEYQQDIEDVARQEHEEATFKREELPGRFTAKKLYGWSDIRYNQEYWRRWKSKKLVKREMIKTIPEEKENKKEKLKVKEWTEEDNNEIGNIIDPYYEL